MKLDISLKCTNTLQAYLDLSPRFLNTIMEDRADMVERDALEALGALASMARYDGGTPERCWIKYAISHFTS